MKRPRRLLVLVCIGILICTFVWLFTHEFAPSYSRGVVAVQILPRQSGSEPVKLRLTNMAKKPVEILGVLVEEAQNGEWFEKTNVSFRTNLRTNATHDISVSCLASNHVYRARVSYWSEKTGLRLARTRIRQALKGRWDSGKPQHWTEGVSDELRP